MSTIKVVIQSLLFGIAFCVSATPVFPQASATPSTRNDQQVAVNQKGEPGFSDRIKRYRVNDGDILELTFEFSPEFNQVVTVQPDGYIVLRDIGDIAASGQTIPQLTSALQTAYSQILYKPAISVGLKDFEKPYFVAGGQVEHPGKYDLRGATTLVQAITMAGGFTEKSKHSQVMLFRRVSEQWTEARVFDVKKMLNTKSLAEDPYIEPGDMLFVPQNNVSKIARYIPHSGVGYYLNRY